RKEGLCASQRGRCKPMCRLCAFGKRQRNMMFAPAVDKISGIVRCVFGLLLSGGVGGATGQFSAAGWQGQGCFEKPPGKGTKIGSGQCCRMPAAPAVGCDFDTKYGR